MPRNLSADQPISTFHRAKLAYVYIHQSTPGQIRHHQESTTLQYRLVERALSCASHYRRGLLQCRAASSCSIQTARFVASAALGMA